MTISVKLKPSTDSILISFIQDIEKELDIVMVKNGFTRTSTRKDRDQIVFKYRQFGVCH